MKKKFTADEVQEWFWEGYITKGEDRRWSSTDTSVVELGGKFYELYAEIGSTECQENYYEDQEAPEVVQIERTIIIKEWVEKEN